MTENEGGNTLLKKVIGVGTAIGIGLGLNASARNAAAQEVPIVDNKPAETAPVQESVLAKEEFPMPTLSVTPRAVETQTVEQVAPKVVETPAPIVEEQKQAEVENVAVQEEEKDDGKGGFELKDIVADDVTLDASGGVSAFSGGEGRNLGQIYYTENNKGTASSDEVNPGGVHLVDGHYEVSGYYRAPNGRYYRIGGTESQGSVSSSEQNSNGYDLKDILPEGTKFDENGDVQVNLGDPTPERTTGNIYPDADGSVDIDVNMPNAPRPDGSSNFLETKGSVSGFYKAPDGKYYPIAQPTPTVEENK